MLVNMTLVRGFSAAALCLCSAALWMATPRAVVPATAAPPPYHLIKQLTLSGTERWDYLTLDSAAALRHAWHPDCGPECRYG